MRCSSRQCASGSSRPGRVRWRYRDFPLDNLHPQARLAAHAAACANDQGKYWEMHRFIYEAQNDWAFKSDAVSQLRNLAKPLGIDMAQYDACMQSAKYAGRIQASLDEGNAAGRAVDADLRDWWPPGQRQPPV